MWCFLWDEWRISKLAEPCCEWQHVSKPCSPRHCSQKRLWIFTALDWRRSLTLVPCRTIWIVAATQSPRKRRISRCFLKQVNIIVKILQAHDRKWEVENTTRKQEYDAHKTDIVVAHPECRIHWQQFTQTIGIGLYGGCSKSSTNIWNITRNGVLRYVKIFHE